MFDKLFAIAARAMEVAPAVMTDVQGTVAKINAAPDTVAKIEDGLAAALAGLEAIFGAAGSK